MTAAQFSALAALIRLRKGPAQEAARMVLVEAMRPADAAAMMGTTRQSVANTLSACRRGLGLARVVVGA